jgi:tRNA (adenine57-N1/adenine58-N1)-methyltransferase
LVERKVYKEGKLVHRTEQDVKTHTSYLVFAILPQDWSEADEESARAKWPVKIRKDSDKTPGDAEFLGLSKRQMKRAARQSHKDGALSTPGGGAEAVENAMENGVENQL